MYTSISSAKILLIAPIVDRCGLPEKSYNIRGFLFFLIFDLHVRNIPMQEMNCFQTFKLKPNKYIVLELSFTFMGINLNQRIFFKDVQILW